MKKITTIAVVAVACAAAISQATPFTVTQAPIASGSSPGVISDLYALNGPGGQGFTSADSFTLAPVAGTTFYITSITTYGFGYNGSHFSPSGFTSMELNIFGNSGALPSSTVMFNQSFNPATAPEMTHTPNGTIAGFPSFKTTVDLSAAPIDMGAGGTFWLNVGGTGAGSATYAWNYSVLNNGNAFRSALISSWDSWTNAAGAGLSYEINGYTEVVPEPATLALGLLVFPALRKRKQK